MLALACMPTVSRWLAVSQQDMSWVQVCSSLGQRWVRLALAESTETSTLHESTECDFCLIPTPLPPSPSPEYSPIVACEIACADFARSFMPVRRLHALPMSHAPPLA